MRYWNRGVKLDTNNVELITKLVIEALNRQEAEKSEKGFLVPVGVSNRHVHLTQEHVETLFGEGYHLTKKKDLMGGQFASNELVTIVGLKLRAIENVRILGPCRSKSQVEISATDARTLGIKAPIRESGNVAGSAPIAVVGADRAGGTERGPVSERGLYRGAAPYTYVPGGLGSIRLRGRRYRVGGCR